ncbi:MAG: sigma-70 family RNA polymerase sigma factor [Sphingomicrobium sp.]
MTLNWTTLTDGELVVLSMAGRDRAFAEIMERYRQPVFRLIRASVREPEEVLDLTQDTFISAHLALARFDAKRPMRAWLFAIAINKCRDWGRKRFVRRFLNRGGDLGAEAQQVADGGALADDIAADRQELERVSREIAALPAKLRETIILRTIEGLSQAETAVILGISEKTVETRLSRARLKLLGS